MKVSEITREAAVLGAAGAALILLGLPAIQRQLVDPSANAYLWQRESVIAALLFGYGAVVSLLAVWSQVLGMRGSSLRQALHRRRTEINSLIRNRLFNGIRYAFGSRQQVCWLIVAVVVGIAVRGYFLLQPMRFDESNTFLVFVNREFLRIFFYPFPNNHVLHTILVKITTSLFGAHPLTIRIPAFLAGVLAIPLIFCVTRVLLRGRSAVFATVAAAVFPYLILYSTTARGYTLMVLFTLSLAFVAALTARAPSKAASAILSLIAALGILAVPSMVFPVAGVYLWLTCLLFIHGNTVREVLREFLIPCALLTVGLVALFYTPVIFVSKGVAPLISNEYVAAEPSAIFFHKLPGHVSGTLSDFIRDVPGPILYGWLALMFMGAYRACRRREWPILLLLPAALIVSAVLLLWKHAIPFPRTWIFLLPLALILANAGWNHVLEKLSPALRGRVQGGFVFAAVYYAAWLVSTNAVAAYDDTGTFPNAPAVADYLEPLMHNGDKVRAAIPVNYPLYFYLWYNGERDFHGEPSADKKEFVIVQRDSYAFDLTPDEPVVKLAQIGDATVYQTVPDEASEPQPSDD